MLDLKIYVKSFMIYADIMLVPEDNGQEIPNESYTNKYQKHFMLVSVIN